MTWTCIPVAVITCGAFVVSPLPHRAAFIHAHPVPACVRVAEPCHMVWMPDAHAMPPMRGPTIGDEPWTPGPTGFSPGSFYYPTQPFMPAEGGAAARSHGAHRERAGQSEGTSPPSGPGLPNGGGTPTPPAGPVKVPEPSGMLTLVVGMAGIGWVRRWKQGGANG